MKLIWLASSASGNCVQEPLTSTGRSIQMFTSSATGVAQILKMAAWTTPVDSRGVVRKICCSPQGR